MLKNKKNLLFLTSLLILLPIVAGLLLWDKLPDQIATHWGPEGQADGWSSKGFAVFALPLFLLAIHWLCLLFTASDRKNENQTAKPVILVLWICPVISLILMTVVYGSSLGFSINMTSLPVILLSLIFFTVGNYLPKCKQNYTIGIRLPWTLASEENWNATHRFSGKVMVLSGFLSLFALFLKDEVRFIAVIVILFATVLITTAYSYLYQRKHG